MIINTTYFDKKSNYWCYNNQRNHFIRFSYPPYVYLIQYVASVLYINPVVHVDISTDDDTRALVNIST